MKLSWTSAGTIAAVLALILAVWLGYTTGTLTPPRLEFGFGAVKGAHDGDLRKAGLSKDGQVTYLVLSTGETTTERAVFLVPFYIANRSSRALHDIVVRFSYPARVAAKFDKIKLVEPAGEIAMDPEYVKFRTVKTIDEVATTEFQINLLRPGEGLMLADLFVLGDPALKASGSTKSSDVRRLAFPARLREQLDLNDVLRVQAFAASAEAGPYTAQLTVMWVRGEESQEAMEAVADRVASAAWGPYRLEPGFHLKWPWQSKGYETEFFELVHTRLSKGIDEAGRAINVQQIKETTMRASSMTMPNWDYWGIIAR